MTTKPVSIVWNGISIEAEVWVEEDPLKSDGRPMYDIDYFKTDLPEIAQRAVWERYCEEIREAILEACK